MALLAGLAALAALAGLAAARTILTGAPIGLVGAPLGLGGDLDPGWGWLVCGGVVGAAVGLGQAHAGIARRRTLRGAFALGAALSALAYAAALGAAFAAATGGFDPGAFARRLGFVGAAWEVRALAEILAAALAAAAGGIVGQSVAAVAGARRVTRRLPDWVLPSSRILMHVARADHEVRNEETDLIVELICRRLPPEAADLRIEHSDALWRVMRGEARVLAAGRRLATDLRHPCFASAARREATAKLAIRLARRDGVVHEDESDALAALFGAWAISDARRAALEAEVEAELAAILSSDPPLSPDEFDPPGPPGQSAPSRDIGGDPPSGGAPAAHPRSEAAGAPRPAADPETSA